MIKNSLHWCIVGLGWAIWAFGGYSFGYAASERYRSEEAQQYERALQLMQLCTPVLTGHCDADYRASVMRSVVCEQVKKGYIQ